MGTSHIPDGVDFPHGETGVTGENPSEHRRGQPSLLTLYKLECRVIPRRSPVHVLTVAK